MKKSKIEEKAEEIIDEQPMSQMEEFGYWVQPLDLHRMKTKLTPGDQQKALVGTSLSLYFAQEFHDLKIGSIIDASNLKRQIVPEQSSDDRFSKFPWLTDELFQTGLIKPPQRIKKGEEYLMQLKKLAEREKKTKGTDSPTNEEEEQELSDTEDEEDEEENDYLEDYYASDDDVGYSDDDDKAGYMD